MRSDFRRLLVPSFLLFFLAPIVVSGSGLAEGQSAEFAAGSAFPAGQYRLDPAHARIAWSVSHLGFSTYRGLIPRVQGTLVIDPRRPEAARLDVTVPMAGISALDDALDARLRGPQFFETARYPTASYHVMGITGGITPTGAATARLDGELTLCGVTHPLSINARFSRAGRDPANGKLTLGFEGAAILRRSLFAIVAYTPLVGDDVSLELEAEFIAE